MSKARIQTGLIAASCVVGAALFFSRTGWGILISAITLMAGWEWTKLSAFRRSETALFLGVLFGLLAGAVSILTADRASEIFQCFIGIETYMRLVVSLFWLLIAPLWLLRKAALRSSGMRLLVGWLILVVPAVSLFSELTFSRGVVLQLLGAVAIADSFAYLAGKAFGKTQLAPSISPGKTWEGAVGAVIGVWLYLSVLALLKVWQETDWVSVWMLFPTPLMMAAIAVVFITTFGDLFESWVKRCANVKDSGRLLPGHGGVLDRIDGLLPFVPLLASVYGAPMLFGTQI